MSRCTGHCCKRFPLPENLDYIKAHRNPDAAREAGDGMPWLYGGEKLAEMLIFIEVGAYSDGRPCFFFTCKHHDTATGDCMDYANRPPMCSDYPYGKPCIIEGCTADNKGVPRDLPEDQLVQIRRGKSHTLGQP